MAQWLSCKSVAALPPPLSCHVSQTWKPRPMDHTSIHACSRDVRLGGLPLGAGAWEVTK